MNEYKKEIPGPAGTLETLITTTTHHRPDAMPEKCWGIICHPHPLFGGTMTNKVVTTIAKALFNLGIHTIRFNFRGVGNSAGQFDHGRGELADLLAVITWAQQNEAPQKIWLAGFSFGAYIAIKAATQCPSPIDALITVAPPIDHFPLPNLPPILCPWILLQGEQDDVVSPTAVFAWAKTCHPQPTILRFPQAGHFFHGQLIELREQLEAALTSGNNFVFQ